jgi:hypothetical protein
MLFFKLSTTPQMGIGEWRYSSMHSLTLALDRGEWSASHPGTIGQETGWAPEPFWMQWWREKFPAPTRNRTLEPHPACSPALYRLSYHGFSLHRYTSQMFYWFQHGRSVSPNNNLHVNVTQIKHIFMLFPTFKKVSVLVPVISQPG